MNSHTNHPNLEIFVKFAPNLKFAESSTKLRPLTSWGPLVELSHVFESVASVELTDVPKLIKMRIL